MRTDLFDYELPPELIAAVPAARREESRLLVVDRARPGHLEHRRFADLLDYLRPGDLLVVNDSRVMPARLRGTRAGTGGQVELLLLRRVSAGAGGARVAGQAAAGDTWEAMARPAKRLRVGEEIVFAKGADGEAKVLRARVVAEGEEGLRTVEFDCPDILPRLGEFGEIPLPPYIVQRRRELAAATPDSDSGAGAWGDDAERYQTVYARDSGSVAAPTAGLHFSPELLAQLEAQGVRRASVTLHVGAGTFKPVEAETLEAHAMHSESFEIPEATVAAIQDTRARGGRVVAVGTTTVRALESAALAASNPSNAESLKT